MGTVEVVIPEGVEVRVVSCMFDDGRSSSIIVNGRYFELRNSSALGIIGWVEGGCREERVSLLRRFVLWFSRG